MKLLRAEIYKSFVQMGQAGLYIDREMYPLVCRKLADPALCGRHAQESTAELPPLATPPPQRNSRAGAQTFEIDRIIAEEPPAKTHWRRYLVRWLGYEPAWESWRIPGHGSPGDPIETWEPHSVVKDTEALIVWKAAQEQQQA